MQAGFTLTSSPPTWTGWDRNRENPHAVEIIWAPSEIPPKCKLQRLEKEQCVAEAEKFIAEFYRHKFIKPAPKDYELNHVGMCCNFVVEPKDGVDDRKFSSSQRTDRE